MAKGEDRLAGVTVDRDVPGDPRYHRLAAILKLANHYEAIGRMVVMWSVCTALKTDRPTLAKIEAVFGDGGPEALLRSDLAERVGPAVEDGSVRIKGCTGRTDWYLELPKQRSDGGKARSRRSQRDQFGRMRAGTISPVAGSILDVTEPAGAISTDLDGRWSQQEPGQEQELVPDQADPSQIDPDHGHPIGSGSTAAAGIERVHPPMVERGGHRARGSVVPPAPPIDEGGAALRRRLVERFKSKVNAARQEIGEEFGMRQVRPIAMQGRGEVDLMERLRESSDPEADLEHVIAVSIKQARKKHELRWLGWSVSTDGGWRTAVNTTLEELDKPEKGETAVRVSERIRARLNETPEDEEEHF